MRHQFSRVPKEIWVSFLRGLTETWRNRNSDALDQRHDVSFRVLEPRSLGATGGQDAILVCLWHVVLLKVHAPRFQLRDVTFDVLDLPECLARLGGGGVWRRVQEARGTFAALVDDGASTLRLY